MIVFNEGQPDRQDTLLGTLGEDTTATIPAIGTSFAVGKALATQPSRVHIATSTTITPTTTSNVIAELAPKNADKAGKAVLLGAHLDSVPEGPGINDNGTGSATILEIAEEMAAAEAPRNPVRFAFWGAEESGLVGSTRYVASLTEEEGAKIGLNLNFDMLGSPNFIRLVYDGDGSAFGTVGPAGSDDIEHAFEQYFAAKGLALDPTAFDGRSDYKPFIAVGIPAGGLFSGAEEVKTPAEQARFGGVAGEAFDRCYHEACDTLSNVNWVGLRQLSGGAVHATAVFADRRDPVGEATAGAAAEERAQRRARRAVGPPAPALSDRPGGGAAARLPARSPVRRSPPAGGCGARPGRPRAASAPRRRRRGSAGSRCARGRCAPAAGRARTHRRPGCRRRPTRAGRAT